MERKKKPKDKVLTNSEKNIQQLEKQTVKEHQNRIKPGNCLKYIKLNIDPNILSNPYGLQILSCLATLGVETNIKIQPIPEIISWCRSVSQKLSNDSTTPLTSSSITEKYLLYVMHAKELNDLIINKDLINKFQNILDIFPDNEVTLLVCGLKEFCRKNTNVGRQSFELNLIELQLILNISHRLLETAADLGNTVMQFSKSVAEIPFKKQEAEKLQNQNFYVTNDNKDCVPVKGIIGLSNLWQHHLIKFPMVTLEIAEAIMSEYPMPSTLIDAYKSSNDGENLLANIPIRRAGGRLTSVRRIGPELSKKLYTMYTNLNPNQIV